MSSPRLLDLFCGAGGCSKGYQLAGFHVTGVDRVKQPRYCGDEFYVDGGLAYLERMLVQGFSDRFDAIHASPPCQAFSNASAIHGANGHFDFLTPTRALLEQTGLPWVIENVPGAPMRVDLVLCGTAFPELRVRRHRWFEFSDPEIAPALVHGCDHSRPTVSVFGHGGHVYHGVEDWRESMGIDWMKRDELAQAIPPAYTELIGIELLAHLEEKAAA